jgi:hypothetical protein
MVRVPIHVPDDDAGTEITLRLEMGEEATGSWSGIVVEENQVVGNGILCAQVLGRTHTTVRLFEHGDGIPAWGGSHHAGIRSGAIEHDHDFEARGGGIKALKRRQRCGELIGPADRGDDHADDGFLC